MKRLSAAFGILAIALALSFTSTRTVLGQVLGTVVQVGTANNVTLSFTNPASPYTLTFADPGGAATVGMFKSQPASLQNPSQAAYVTSQYTNSTTGFTSVTGAAIAVLASTNYNIVCRILYQSTTGGAGNDLKLQFTGPASPTAVAIEWTHALTTGTLFNATATAFGSPMDPNGAPTGGTNFGDTIHVGLINGVNAGTVQLQGALHTAAGSAQIQVGSGCIAQ